MRVLCFTDVHGQKEGLKRVIEKARNVDILVCAGDLSIFRNGLENALRMLNKTGKLILIIPGNHEDEADIKELSNKFQRVISIHKRIYEIGNYMFIGYGGGGFSFRERGMEAFFRRISAKLLNGKKIVFVTHAPPYNTELDYLPWLKEHRGCRSTTDVIKNIKPQLVVCGHFHETANKSCYVGKTFVINPGPNGRIVSL